MQAHVELQNSVEWPEAPAVETLTEWVNEALETAGFDAEEPDKRRALYRMWINLHQSAAVIPQHAALRSGIRGPSPVIAAA